MKKIMILLLCVLFFIEAGCTSYRIEDGKMDKNGHVFYPLCERSKQRITDLQSMSFELPMLFKQVSCEAWTSYSLHTQWDRLNISIYSTIGRDSLMAIGLGGHSMEFQAGIWYSRITQKWEYSRAAFSPEVFLVDIVYRKKKLNLGTPIESGFVDSWRGGRCARLRFGGDRFFDYLHSVEYYCWPYSSGNNRQPPFYIEASQSIPKKNAGIPPKSDFTDLDNQLIKPVLDSLEFYPLPDEALQMVANKFSDMCNKSKDIFFNKEENQTTDFPDRRSIILTLRDCGYDIPDPKITIDSCNDIFGKTRDQDISYPSRGRSFELPKDYQLIEVIEPYGKFSYEQFVRKEEESIRKAKGKSRLMPNWEVWYVYKIPSGKFSRIEQDLMKLDLLKETEPLTRRLKDYSQGSSSSYIEVPYDAWYYVPPYYKRQRKDEFAPGVYRVGIGFRYDQDLKAHVMDIYFDPDTASGYKFITLVEGD